MRKIVYLLLGPVLLLGACAYRVVAGPLAPLAEEAQTRAAVEVADDGKVTYNIERLRVSLRPMTDSELDRQFPPHADGSQLSNNPYTYGAWVPEGQTRTPAKFTVFLLQVENYEFPKVLVNPLHATMTSQNGRTYESYSFAVLKELYYPYNRAYAGNPGAQFREWMGRLRNSMYPAAEEVFAGQSVEGYIVFPRLHDDVIQVAVEVNGVALRFDYKNEPSHTADLVYNFQRQVRRQE